jgi:hypothetical protein
MIELRYTLVSDGSSDRALLPVLSWLLRENQVRCPIQAEWADLRRICNPPRRLAARIQVSLEFFPCDLLFVHRDAETFPFIRRKAEINNALSRLNFTHPPAVCVIPVRMMEAWLLFSEPAIRRAAGNPNGQTPLTLPQLSHLEQLPDPKSVLFELLKNASGLSSGRLKRFDVRHSAGLVSRDIENFSPLRTLLAFQALEDDVRSIVANNQWNI